MKRKIIEHCLVCNTPIPIQESKRAFAKCPKCGSEFEQTVTEAYIKDYASNSRTTRT